MTFKTENGSVYTLDKGTMGWCRQKSDKSGVIRQEFGTLRTWPEICVGHSVWLDDNKAREGCTHHFVQTSLVTEVTE